jgi:hypothetical protein
MVYTSLSSVKSRRLTKGAPVKKKTKKNQQNQQKGTKKLAINRETIRALNEGNLAVVAGGGTICPTACSVC